MFLKETAKSPVLTWHASAIAERVSFSLQCSVRYPVIRFSFTPFSDHCILNSRRGWANFLQKASPCSEQPALHISSAISLPSAALRSEVPEEECLHLYLPQLMA